MSKLVLNVGLENNPYGYDVLRDYFISRGAESVEYAIGQWDGVNEPTCVVSINSERGVDYVESLCRWTTQTAIAVKLDGVGELVYNPSYSGQRYVFDEKYFISPSVEVDGEYSGTLHSGVMVYEHPDGERNAVVHGQFECDGVFYYHRFKWMGIDYVVKAKG